MLGSKHWCTNERQLGYQLADQTEHLTVWLAESTIPKKKNIYTLT